jgi:riboflavin kinase / FMN adenylyltransferase
LEFCAIYNLIVRVFRDLKEFERLPNAIVTTGTFDGVHAGHQKIIENLQSIAASEGGESVLLTFYPHPRLVLFPEDNDLKLLNTLEEKIILLEKTGVDNLIIHPFTQAFSRYTATQYVENILIESIGVKKLVIGYDHHFGRNREGSYENLLQMSTLYDFKVVEIPAQEIDEVNVSSTKIRTALINGDIETANSFLNYNYSITGEVIHGNQLGRTIGFPTANLKIDNSYKLIPGQGVYAVEVLLNNIRYNGMLNIGYRPTINNVLKQSIEVNIFNFEKEIYGEKITLTFLKKIREEKKFETLDKLKTQLNMDRLLVISLLKN